jgi:hypothetical protein
MAEETRNTTGKRGRMYVPTKEEGGRAAGYGVAASLIE